MQSFPHRHFLSIRDLERTQAGFLLDRAEHHLTALQERRHGIIGNPGRLLVNLFFEPSTRTQSAFNIAATRLGAHTVHFSPASSSMKKGEDFLDTARTLDAMGPDWIVMRHAQEGAPERVSRHIKAHLINAGDGTHQHPTQALLDALVLRRHFNSLDGLNILICGDLLHSRVARSDAQLFSLLGAHVRLCAPPEFKPCEVDFPESVFFSDFDQALKECDAVIMLRLQKERMDSRLYPSKTDYHRLWGLHHDRLACAKPGAVVLHPSPFSRGVEISSELVDDPKRCLVWQQVQAGVAARMAVLQALVDRHV